MRGTREEGRSPHRALRGRDPAPADGSPRDGTVDGVQLRRLRPGGVGADSVAGREGPEGLYRGSAAQRQHGPLRGDEADHRHGLFGGVVGRPRRRSRVRDARRASGRVPA